MSFITMTKEESQYEKIKYELELKKKQRELEMSIERKLAKIINSDLKLDRGHLYWSGEFEYEEGGVQGLGYGIDRDFIKGLMEAVGSSSLHSMNGKSCWVSCSQNDNILKIEPLHKKDGTPFSLDEWKKKLK